MNRKLLEKFKTCVIRNFMEHITQNQTVFIYQSITDGFERLKRDMKENSVYVLVDTIDDIEEAMSNGCMTKNMLKFDNMSILKNVLKLDLKDNVELHLLIIKNTFIVNDEVKYKIEEFEMLKNEILAMPENKCYRVFNYIINDGTYNDEETIESLQTIIYEAKHSVLELTFGNRAITNDDFDKMKNNLSKIHVEVVDLTNLTRYDLKSKFLRELML